MLLISLFVGTSSVGVACCLGLFVWYLLGCCLFGCWVCVACCSYVFGCSVITGLVFAWLLLWFGLFACFRLFGWIWLFAWLLFVCCLFGLRLLWLSFVFLFGCLI